MRRDVDPPVYLWRGITRAWSLTTAVRSGRHLRLSHGALGIAVAGTMLSGCLPGKEGISVWNRTDTVLKITLVDETGQEIAFGNGIAAGLSVLTQFRTKDHCTFNPLVARALDGHIVARRDAPLCDGQTWEIVGQ